MAKPATTKKNKPLSKSEILNAVADAVGEELSRKHVKAVLEHLVDVGHKELKKAGVFVLHGFAKFGDQRRGVMDARGERADGRSRKGPAPFRHACPRRARVLFHMGRRQPGLRRFPRDLLGCLGVRRDDLLHRRAVGVGGRLDVTPSS